MTDETDEYKYRMDLVRAYGNLSARERWYEFTATSDQDAAAKVGTLGQKHLETFYDGYWVKVHIY